MNGKTAEEARRTASGRPERGGHPAPDPDKVFEGNRPTNSILFQKLTRPCSAA